MKYAFDWDGVLNCNPELVEIARSLLKAGHEVYVISIAWLHDKREEVITKFSIENNILFTKIYVINETGSLFPGIEKVKIMREIGCRVIFDDTPDVIQHAKNAGFLALKVPYLNH